ncbi:carbohydrate-binding family 9-like protein [Cyclobacterium marinum]|uniref:carbohydrate-binding family 9-like protein n=1 Tax=Cyclobacterium marinum TaxID=104 RepID=UPI0011EF0855|nr:carbohydrate-binding family 9-like protein [Cyclobacterium marinum]MBI0400686.1 carbohydrate-binding family 9-like protein [Cyclobacterium marinum]
MFKRPLTLLALLSLQFHAISQEIPQPRSYVAYQVSEKPIVDGQLNESAWQAADWSEPFLDIQGPDLPTPNQLTQMKMLWDQEYLYIGVKLYEKNIWATYTERESVIFHENDIEVFIDPDGDTHNYYEIEVNALGTLWDLLLTKPYKNGGKPINGWNINDLEYAIHLSGTINDPTDLDDYWSIEMAIPWKSLSQSGPSYKAPADGEQWRINFSRVQWQIAPNSNGYKKIINPKTGKSFPEDNWVWSPMGPINMHLPERWGYLQFSKIIVGEGKQAFQVDPNEKIKNELRKLYDAEKKFFAGNGRYTNNLSELNVDTSLTKVEIEATQSWFKISSPAVSNGEYWHITEDSKIWKK